MISGNVVPPLKKEELPVLGGITGRGRLPLRVLSSRKGALLGGNLERRSRRRANFSLSLEFSQGTKGAHTQTLLCNLQPLRRMTRTREDREFVLTASLGWVD